jgi:hypothetical protein
MSRINNQISNEEVQAYKTWCAANNVIADGSDDSTNNANIVRDYFLDVWKETINDRNLEAAKSVLLPTLKIYAPDQQEFHEALKKLTAVEQQAFSDWVPPRGLVVTNKACVALLSWLIVHKLPVNAANLQLCVGQQVVAPFLEWEHVSAHRETEHSRTDDGKGFLQDEGLRKLPDGSYGRTRADYAREAREAQEKANPQTAEQKLSVEDASWRRVAEEACAYGSHSQQAQIRKVFQASVDAGLSWRKVCEACTALRNTFKRNEMVQNRAGYYSR